MTTQAKAPAFDQFYTQEDFNTIMCGYQLRKMDESHEAAFKFLLDYLFKKYEDNIELIAETDYSFMSIVHSLPEYIEHFEEANKNIFEGFFNETMLTISAMFVCSFEEREDDYKLFELETGLDVGNTGPGCTLFEADPDRTCATCKEIAMPYIHRWIDKNIQTIYPLLFRAELN